MAPEPEPFLCPLDNTHHSVYFYHMNSAELAKILVQAGFKLVSIRGSHHKYRHPDGRVAIVPHPRKDLGVGLVNKILRKDARIE